MYTIPPRTLNAPIGVWFSCLTTTSVPIRSPRTGHIYCGVGSTLARTNGTTASSSASVNIRSSYHLATSLSILAAVMSAPNRATALPELSSLLVAARGLGGLASCVTWHLNHSGRAASCHTARAAAATTVAQPRRGRSGGPWMHLITTSTVPLPWRMPLPPR